MSNRIYCPGPVSRRGLIKSSIAASLGFVLGRHMIPTAWADDKLKAAAGIGKGSDKGAPAAAAPSYTVAKGRAKNIVLIWLGGGPSHLDTFDPKPGTAQAGGVKAIEAADGLQLSEKLPELAKQGKNLCVLRGMHSKEGDHGQASHLMHTGYREQSGVEFPGMGSVVCAEAKDGPRSELPSYVSINGGGFGPGFLGAEFGPFHVYAGNQIPDLLPPGGTSAKNIDERRELLRGLDNHYGTMTGAPLAKEHWNTYERAVKLSRSPLAKLFEIKGDDVKKAESYGTNKEGRALGMARACFVAKRLIAQGGVRFIEIEHGGWDTHAMVNERTDELCYNMDKPIARLIEELAVDGLLSSTLVICMGEFGRTPDINKDQGRDHYPRCYSMFLSGGGVKGGQAVGKSNPTGHEPDAGKGIVVPDMFYSVCEAAGIDPTRIRESADGRPIQVVDRGAKPVPGIFG